MPYTVGLEEPFAPYKAPSQENLTALRLSITPMNSPAPPVWFITGSSSGFGRHMTELVLQNGGIAVATLRSPSALSDLAARYPSSQLLVLPLDVRQPEAIPTAFAEALAAFGRINVVFNNAGCGVLSEAEGSTDDVVRPMFDANFWGAARVSREAVRVFREVNQPAGGRLLQVSSMGGVQGLSALSYYCASKCAIEGFTEALAAEMRPEWDVKVTLIELGGFHTNAGRNMVRLPPHPAYVDPVLKQATARSYLQVNPWMPGDAAKATAKIYKLTELPDPPLHLPLGKDAQEAVKRKAQSLLAMAESFSSWSEGLELDVPLDRP
ncbi:uncharacterized protein FIBRA_06552 [Fibroporia radiculosa]|uniref:NAD(P)-binding protein n=1 Tax=Fibroporia radiculosa TaxID=599839 RepID=J4GBW2_9APHY|nr:uncharacterized protein FIBRA_06552 [Fibroporia radiculosa]CCM04378.1 predicted protein [Fibroporia radiculosa]